MTPAPARRRRALGLLPAFALGGGAALAVGLLLLRVFVVEAFKIPSGSMIPTLRVGDHVLVDKLAYRGQPPRRGDVAVFRRDDKFFVSRVVAVGGDTVALPAGKLVLNGAPVPRRERPGPCSFADVDQPAPDRVERPCLAFEETLDGRTYVVIRDPGVTPLEFKTAAVPDGQFFVAGDNRDNSHDSRYYGPLPTDSLVGRVWRVWWRPSR
jgi:signal peptidase I